MGAKNAQWLRRAKELADTHAARVHRGDMQMRTSLAELWRLVIDCSSTDLAIAFRNVHEATLVEAAEAGLAELQRGALRWYPANTIANTGPVIGVAMRTLDLALKEGAGFGFLSRNGESYRVDDAGCYVVPRLHPKLLSERGPYRGPGRGFARRATPHHRCIPTEIDGKAVEIVIDPAISGLSGQRGTTCGAGFIPGMALEPTPVEGLWTGRDTPTLQDDAALVARQVEAAFAEPMLGIMWPELSMFPPRRKYLETALTKSAAFAPLAHGPSFVVAGSAHVAKDGGTTNEMRILDRFGTTRATYDKLRAYVRSVEEDIALGERIVVLATDEWLVTFAICLDFCDTDVATPFLELDVDLIFVSSLANRETMKGHENNASSHGTRYGSAAFVVQQNEESGGPLGFVYPSEGNRGVYDVDEDWTTRSLKFSASLSIEGKT